MSNSKKNFVILQYFRGIAALLVLLHHITGLMYEEYGFQYNYLNGYFSPGWAGVDFFFVLSGFIIFYIHEKDLGDKTKFKPFLLKRVVRIYPIYWIATLLWLPIFLTFNDHRVSIMKSFLLFPQETTPVLQVGWSLSYEMLFYLILSLLIFLRPKYSLPILSIWIVGILINLPNIDQNLYQHIIFSPYNIEFLLGVVAAYLVKRFNNRLGWLVLIVGITGFLLSWLSIQYGVFGKFTIARILGFGLSSALIIGGSAAIDLRWSNLPRSNVLFYLGDASYSIYLIHFPVFRVLGKIFSVANIYNTLGLWLSTTVILIITIIIGCLFHTFVENPMLKMLNTILKRRKGKNEIIKQAI
ncbi:acyltransferase family protein [Bacillus mycoides]|uniref:acyltransferase family protein n=1 Tax=Bacillus mycoides TaxID=1405 RepID=UPI001F08B778|nr:acyltransferase [Bacillus mycoides]